MTASARQGVKLGEVMARLLDKHYFALVTKAAGVTPLNFHGLRPTATG